MERESQLQQSPIGPIDRIAPRGTRRRKALLCLFMLLPWLWVGLGLHWLKDYRLTILIYELLGCLLPIYLFQGRRTEKILPIQTHLGWLLALTLLFAILILGAFWFTHYFYMDWHDFHSRMQNTRLIAANWEFWLFAALIVLVNPVLEECFWRGVVYRELQGMINQRRARYISSFFFGGWHWVVLQAYCSPFWSVVLSMAVAFGGLIFARLYDDSKTLGASIILHGLGTDLPMALVVYQCILQANTWGLTHP